MPKYLVTWTIDIDADSPREAAELARLIQLDPDSEAVYFDVDGEEIDLFEENE